MVTDYEFKELVKNVLSHYENLLRIAHSERLEFGDPKEDTTRRFNALYFAMLKSYDILNKGLDGKFPWEYNL